MIEVFVLKSYQYSMLLDCYYNPQKVSQNYFVNSAKKQRGYYNASHIFATKKNEKIYTHDYKVPSVFAAKKSYAIVRKILKSAHTHYFCAFEREIYNDSKKNIEIERLNIRTPHKLGNNNHAIIILSYNIICDSDYEFIAKEIKYRKFLKKKHTEKIVKSFFVV